MKKKILALVLLVSLLLSMLANITIVTAKTWYYPSNSEIQHDPHEGDSPPPWSGENYRDYPCMFVYRFVDEHKLSTEEVIIPVEEEAEYVDAGWYPYPIECVYAEDGQEKIINKADLDKYLNEGWSRSKLYFHPDGSIERAGMGGFSGYGSLWWEKPKDGWYTYPVATIYTPYRSMVVHKKDVSRYVESGWYPYEVAAMYSADGREIIVLYNEIQAYEAVGWEHARFEYTMVYAPDGTEKKIPTRETKIYEAAGWSTKKEIKMYAADGREISVRREEIKTWENVGWYTFPVTTMYSADGRTIIVAKGEVEAYKNVGWYIQPVSAMVYGYALLERFPYVVNSAYVGYESGIYEDYDVALVVFTPFSAYLTIYNTKTNEYILDFVKMANSKRERAFSLMDIKKWHEIEEKALSTITSAQEKYIKIK